MDRILIADDFPGLAETLAEILALELSDTVSVSVAHNGAEAVRAAISGPLVAAILDIDMPVMGGVEAAQVMRHQLTPAPLLVAMTGDLTHLAGLQASKLFDWVIGKPVSGEALAQLLTRLRAGRRAGA